MNRWEPRNGGHYCTEHNADFPIGEVCDKCIVEPGIAPGEETRVDPNELELKALESTCISEMKHYARLARDQCKKGGRDVGTGCKLSAEAVKWLRAALDVRDRYAPRQETEELIREYRKLIGKDGSN